jgi:hypothetical protein
MITPDQLKEGLGQAFKGMGQKMDIVINEVIEHWYPGLDAKEVRLLNKMYWCIWGQYCPCHEEMFFQMNEDLVCSKFEVYQIINKLCNKKIIKEMNVEELRTNTLLADEYLRFRPYLRFWSYDFEEEVLNAMSEVYDGALGAHLGPIGMRSIK